MISAFRTVAVLLASAIVLMCTAAFTSSTKPVENAAVVPVFRAYDVYLDTDDQSLAAWQIEVSIAGEDGTANVTLVGVEGGEHEAFAEPAYYDPAALHENQIAERIVLAAFSTNERSNLPSGRTRVARLHVMLDDNETYTPNATLIVSATTDAQPINAQIEIVPANGETE